jgi:hypothetical protein
MMPTGPFNSYFVVPRPSPERIADLQRRLAAVQRLSKGIRVHLSGTWKGGVDDICGAIEELLGRDISEALDAIENPKTFARPAVTPEMLVDASERVATIQNSVDTTLEFTKELPKRQAAFFEANVLPPLKAQLADAERWLEMIQRELEEQQKGTNE